MSTLTKAGRYELREELGRGSMGVVHRAHDPVIGRDVAVKTLHLSEAGTGMSHDELISRFQTEARAAGLLAHPNIVVVFDAGETEGLFYITMELVEGRSLQTLLDGRQLFPLPRIIKIMEQVCSALDFAHQHGVVHRDVKPANLMLTSNDTVKITDFGTAKILQFGTAQTAHVMGTPSYMSPEQVKGKPVDGRSDIFSLGVILYEMVTGEKPFPGQNITTVIYKIINEEPIPPQSLDSSIHTGLSNVIRRALSKDPAARYQTCGEFLNALKNHHDLSDPDATVKTAVVNAKAKSASVRMPGPSTRPPAALSGPRNSTTDSGVLLIPAEDAGGGSSRGRVLLTFILLGIIGFAGYRVWPPMKDMWQRMHEDGPLAPAKTASAMPETPAAMPTGDASVDKIPANAADTKSDAASLSKPAPAADPKPGTNTDASPNATVSREPAGGTVLNATARQAAALSQDATAPSQPALPQSNASSATAPASESVRTPATVPPPVVVPVSAANAFRTKLRTQLSHTLLAGKINIQTNGNALTLSGKLTAEEYHTLLNLLRSSPSAVKIIDDIDVGDVSRSPVN